MNTRNWQKQQFLRQRGFWFALGTTTLAAGTLPADQPVIYNGPLVPVTPIYEREQQQQSLTNSPEVFIPMSQAPRLDLPGWLHYGPLHIRPHFDYQYLYGSGVEAGAAPSIGGLPAVQITGTTSIQTITPGFLLEYGRHWALDYTPTLMLYSNSKFHDTVGHSVTLSGGTSYEDWQFGLIQSYNNSEQVLAETGAQTFLETFGTTFQASRVLNDKMSADFSLGQRIQDTDGLQGSRDWSLSSYLNYQFWDRLTASAGLILGYVNLDFGSDQTYQNLQSRVKWRITDKMGLSANAGVEVRELAAGGDIISPVYGLSFEYQPRSRTQLSVGLNSSVSPSLLYPDQVTQTTIINAGINQRLLKDFDLSLGVNYGETDYAAVNNTTSRTDKTTGFNVRLSHPLFKRGTISAIYQITDNQSSLHEFSYHSEQFGGEFNYTF